MVLEIIEQMLGPLLEKLSLAAAIASWQPLLLFVIGMVIYSIFVFKFYRFIARRDVFRLSEGGKEHLLARLGYVLEYIFLFPVVAFVWFLVISILLLVLSSILYINNIFFVSIAMLATIRICAYYSEELSKDIAKLIPFALLAILMIDLTDISITAIISLITELPGTFETLAYYFFFIVVLELFLKIIISRIRKPKVEEKTEENE